MSSNSTLQAPPSGFTLPVALAVQGYALRSEADGDTSFLLDLYGSTREEELAPVPWPPEQKREFVQSQFELQRKHYRAHIPRCAFDVIEHDGVPIGRLYLEPRVTQLHIVDIALLPAWRNNGLGSAIVRAIMETARETDRGVGIFVELNNPHAYRLYRRLGFADIADRGAHIEMEWLPSPAQPA